MAVEDIDPIELGNVEVPDEDPRLEGILTGTNSHVKDFRALKAAFLSSYNTGEPVIDAYRKSKASQNADSDLAVEAANKSEVDKQAILEVYDESLTQNPAQFEESAPLVNDLLKKVSTDALDPTMQFVESISAPETDEETKRSLSHTTKLYEMLREAEDDTSAWEYVGDFFTSLIPLVDTANEAALTGSVLGNVEAVEKAIFAFKGKPYEWQIEMFPTFIEMMKDQLGEIKGFELVRKFIDPTTNSEDLGEYSDWWKIIDAVDIGSMGATVALKTLAVKSAYNIPKVLKVAGDEKTAADATVSALLDDEAGSVMNVDKFTAASNALPFDVSMEDIAHTGGLSVPSQERLEKVFGKITDTTESILSGDGYLRQGILHDAERVAAEADALSRLRVEQFEDIRVAGKTDNTTTFSYKSRDEDGNITEDSYTLDLTLNKVGQYDQSQLRAVSGYLDSPTVALLGNARTDADIAQVMDGQTAKMFNDLVSLRKESLAPLGNLNRPKNKKRLKQVDAVLIEGDRHINRATGEVGTVFDVDTLKSVYGLDEDQVHAYYATNRMYNSLWAIRNQAKREEMIAFDFKGVNLTKADGTFDTNFGKSLDTPAAAKQSMIREEVTGFYDAEKNITVANVSEDLLEKEYASGKTLVRLESPYNIGEDRGKWSYALVNSSDVSELPQQVIARKRGYVPKTTTDGFWFVKEMGKEVLNGKPRSGLVPVKTLRYFDNVKDAQTYRDKLILEDIEKGVPESVAKNKYKELEDREQEIIATATGNFSSGSGGAYTGARSQDEILFGLEGEKGHHLNAFEALTRNIANVSTAMPINQWRLGLEQRWINTANSILGVKIDKFGKLPDEIQSTRKGAFLNKMADQIRDWQGFPSPEEQKYNAITQRLHEWALGKDSTKLQAVTGWLRDADPIAAARATAFHGLLGWFNPAQLWVQSQGMAIAVSLNIGDNLTTTLRNTTALTFLGHGENIGKVRYKLAAKAADMDASELEDLHSMWIKSGLQDSVLQTADHAAALKGHGIAMSAISDAANKSLFFYRNGELLNRRMAFTTAYDEFKKGKIKGFEGAGEVTDEALKAIVTRSNNLMLNMSKANRAQFQKGIASVGTQFFQVSAKAVETATGLNGNFTAAERGRMMAGQLALYGTAGVPLINLGTNYLLEGLGVTQQDIDNNPQLVKLWNDGFWGTTTLNIFGVDAELSKRGSLLRGVTEFADRILFDDTSLPEVFLGAFGATGTRFWDNFTDRIAPFTPSAWNPSILNAAKLPLMIPESISTWKNVEKAVFMETVDKIFDRSGAVSVERKFELREAVMAAIGFQLSDETKAWSLREREDAYKKVNERKADLIVKRMNDVSFRAAAGTLTDEYRQETGEFYALVLGSIDDQDRRSSIMRSVSRRIKSDSREGKAVSSYIKKMYSDFTDGLELLRDGLTGTAIQSVRQPDDKE